MRIVDVDIDVVLKKVAENQKRIPWRSIGFDWGYNAAVICFKYLITGGVGIRKSVSSSAERDPWAYNCIKNPTYRICKKCGSVYRVEKGECPYNFCPCCGIKKEAEDHAGE